MSHAFVGWSSTHNTQKTIHWSNSYYTGVLTCAHIHSIERKLHICSLYWTWLIFVKWIVSCMSIPSIEPDWFVVKPTRVALQGELSFLFPADPVAYLRRMSGGIQALTLPAGYLGSSFIGAALIACGFDTNASKIASIVLAVFFLFTLWWARRDWL